MASEDLPLTRRMALEVTRELWEWRKDNLDKPPEAWPGWEKYGWMENSCACCEFDTIMLTKERKEDTPDPVFVEACRFCPLKGRWFGPGKKETENFTRCCDTPRTIYEKFRLALKEDNAVEAFIQAHNVVEICKEALDDLEPGE